MTKQQGKKQRKAIEEQAEKQRKKMKIMKKKKY